MSVGVETGVVMMRAILKPAPGDDVVGPQVTVCGTALAARIGNG